MRKLSMICLPLLMLNCVHSEPIQDVKYRPQFRVFDLEGERWLCQSPDDIELLFKKLHYCKDKCSRRD